MANIDIRGGSFHFRVFLVTSYCYVILLFCSLVFQHSFSSFFFFGLLPRTSPCTEDTAQVANDMTKPQAWLQPHNPRGDLPQMSWQLQLLPSVIGTGVRMPEALISRHDRDSLVKTALPFWSFHSVHFSSRCRNVARCHILHPISACAVPGWHLDGETICQGYQTLKGKEGNVETIYLFFFLASLLQWSFCDAL